MLGLVKDVINEWELRLTVILKNMRMEKKKGYRKLRLYKKIAEIMHDIKDCILWRLEI